MKTEDFKRQPVPFIRELCKDKTEGEKLEAEENFRDYLMVIKEICNRIGGSGNDQSDFDDKFKV